MQKSRAQQYAVSVVPRSGSAFSRRAIWALHDHEALNRIINDVGSLLTALERTSPPAELQRSAETDIKILGSPDALRTLLAAVEQGGAKAADRILQKAAKQQAGHQYSRTTNMAKAKTLMGDHVSKHAVSAGYVNTGRAHNYKDTTNHSEAVTLMGNSIGTERGFFD
ncbi:uncharacterized protein EKO05_0004648 [Ascochyta rabiei]|uniref:uncharacterized protein n=1 Tax=Didymella rabiei TaxID=5454 RepID=UPI001900907B|nr:uncharacterized protein EKO05_0004648 [Ascochyta rabiei]UPX14158.1 hypothetical protein EKO05_0004648 [Ascochyta rabiei]